MPLWLKHVSPVAPTRLEVQEKTISLIAILAAALLMLGGLGAILAEGAVWIAPGPPAMPLINLSCQPSWGWLLMSLGIIILGVLPLLRVALAVKAYADAGAWGNLLAALVVLAELLLSMVWGLEL